MTGARWEPLAGVRSPRTLLRLNLAPGSTIVPFRAAAAILMLLVRGGLSGNCVVKVETFSLIPQPRAISVVTLAGVETIEIGAVRVCEVSAAKNDFGMVSTSSFDPARAGTTCGEPATRITVASTGSPSAPGMAARTKARSFAASNLGWSVRYTSATRDSTGAYCVGWSATEVRPATNLTGPDIAGVANSFAARLISAAGTSGWVMVMTAGTTCCPGQADATASVVSG